MDLPIVFNPVSEIMQNMFNYMHFKINKTIKQKKGKRKKEIEVFMTRYLQLVSHPVPKPLIRASLTWRVVRI